MYSISTMGWIKQKSSYYCLIFCLEPTVRLESSFLNEIFKIIYSFLEL